MYRKEFLKRYRSIDRGDDMDKTITEQLCEIAEAMCDMYCKYPEQWNGDPEELHESEVCRNCPLTKIMRLSTEFGMI